MIEIAALKKGFVVYFNNYPLMATLPVEQRGMLFSVLMIYADRVWREPSVTLDEVMEAFPGLSSETRMACGFMGAAVQRDTQRWMDRQQCRGQNSPGRKQSTVSVSASEQTVEQDMDRVRRMMERFRREEAEKQDA